MKIRKKFLTVFASISILAIVIMTWITSGIVESSLINYSISINEVQNIVNDIRIYVFIVGLSFIIILWFFAFVLSGRIGSIIKRLVVTLKSISEGNLDNTINLKRKDEIGELANYCSNLQFSCSRYY